MIRLVLTAVAFWLVASSAFAQPAQICRVRAHDGGGTYSIGTGVLIEEDGMQFVLTNCHVVQDAVSRTAVSVTWPSARMTRKAYIIARTKDSDEDTAVLAIEGGKVPMRGLEVAEPTSTQVSVYGFGQGRFAGQTTTLRDIGSWYELGGPVRSGDSGSPVLDQQGRVVGLVWGSDSRTAIAVRYGPLRRMVRAIRTRIAQIMIPKQYCYGGQCRPGQPEQPQPIPRQPIGGGMRPIYQLPPDPGQPEQPLPDPGQPLPDPNANSVADHAKQFDAINSRIDSLEQQCGENADAMADAIKKLSAQTNKLASSVGGLVSLQETQQSVIQNLAARPDSFGEIDALQAKISSLQQRIKAEEDRTVTLEVYRDGELVGDSTGRRIVRFDVESINAERR